MLTGPRGEIRWLMCRDVVLCSWTGYDHHHVQSNGRAPGPPVSRQRNIPSLALQQGYTQGLLGLRIQPKTIYCTTIGVYPILYNNNLTNSSYISPNTHAYTNNVSIYDLSNTSCMCFRMLVGEQNTKHRILLGKWNTKYYVLIMMIWQVTMKLMHWLQAKLELLTMPSKQMGNGAVWYVQSTSARSDSSKPVGF